MTSSLMCVIIILLCERVVELPERVDPTLRVGSKLRWYASGLPLGVNLRTLALTNLELIGPLIEEEYYDTHEKSRRDISIPPSLIIAPWPRQVQSRDK